jgi:hypothetical protein
MLVLKILAVIAAIAGLIAVVTWFNEHCVAKFGHAFFTKKAFGITTAALCLLFLGHMWQVSAIKNHGDVLNGIVLMVIGALVACGMVYVNVRRTNVAYGISGSVAQLGLFGILAAVWLPLMLMGLVLYWLVLWASTPVYVVNR